MERETARHQASEMLRAFASVGAGQFDVTWTNRAGEKQLFRRGVALDVLMRWMPQLLDQAARQERNLIVRPCPPPVFLQLDDLDAAALARVRPAAFLTLDTSPGNHQAWLALAGSTNDDFARRVRKGTGADVTASGATRVAGSINFKDKYAPDFPYVKIGHVTPGRMVTTDELQSMDLVAPAELPKPPRVSGAASYSRRNLKWPDYRKCLEGAPANHSGSGQDVSRADYTWCLIAADWGWSVEATAHRLMEESAKAKENGARYATLTATRAAEAAMRAHNRQSVSLRPVSD
jgi:hypothetical protein